MYNIKKYIKYIYKKQSIIINGEFIHFDLDSIPSAMLARILKYIKICLSTFIVDVSISTVASDTLVTHN